MEGIVFCAVPFPPFLLFIGRRAVGYSGKTSRHGAAFAKRYREGINGTVWCSSIVLGLHKGTFKNNINIKG